MSEAARVGKRGAVVIPAKVRRQFGIAEGTTVLVHSGPDGVVIRSVATVPVEVYSRKRRAAFILQSWLKPEDYPKLRDQVRRMGIDPDKVRHTRPSRRPWSSSKTDRTRSWSRSFAESSGKKKLVSTKITCACRGTRRDSLRPPLPGSRPSTCR